MNRGESALPLPGAEEGRTVSLQPQLLRHQRVRNAAKAIRDKVDPFAFNYIHAELEGMYLDNLVKYPFIVSDVNKKPLQECTPKGYWEALDGYQVKSDKASLKSYAYIGWLIDYLEYREKCEARKAGKE